MTLIYIYDEVGLGERIARGFDGKRIGQACGRREERFDERTSRKRDTLPLFK
jgi:hypothetical protein